MPRANLEVIRTRLLVARSRMLVESAQRLCNGTAQEIERAHQLIAMSVELLSADVQEAILSLPTNGDWAPGRGRFSKVISEMLDNGTLLIEEDQMPEDGNAPWRVRLTNETINCLA
jgi:hypothetical protein